MKVKPDTKTFEEFIATHNLNSEDVENFHIQYIFPIQSKARYKHELKIRNQESFYNDLFDNDIEFETFLNNLKPKPKSIKEMTPREKAVHLQSLIDAESESLT